VKYPALFSVLCLFVSAPADAESPNAAAILKACATGPGAPTESCKAYVNGVVAGVLVDQIAREQGKPICFPAHLTTDQAIVAVATFIAQHPTLWTTDGNSTVGVALQTAYPCD
jgi:hypothetical protein